MEYGEHFKALFRGLEEEHGRLDRKIVGAIVGFSAGGPVSLSTIKRKKIHVTCELSLHEEQKPSAEGLRFELLSVGSFDLPTCRALFTAIGDLSLQATLGHDHTIGVGDVLGGKGPEKVRLVLFSKTEIDGRRYGVYEVVPD